jgi:uncharacterized protein (DUF433 family)
MMRGYIEMMVQNRIEINHKVMHGKPVIKGTRILVGLILGYLAGDMTVQEILEEYPTLTREDILACLEYASYVVDTEEVLEVAALAG